METIKLDLIPGKKMPSLHASQYDEGRDYHIDLTENRVPYELDGTEVLSLEIRKCDNTLCTMDIANSFGGKKYIEFRTTEQMNACAGFNYGEIKLEKNGVRIGSLNFYLQVEGAPDEGGITSESEINNLSRQVHDIVVKELEDNGAEETGYDNSESGLTATNVQDAIDEVNEKVNEKADTSSLAEVATSGSYNDLLDKPSIPAPQVNSDWNANSGVSQILNKPNLANVATSGNYNDLSNKPSIPAAQVNSDWNANSGVRQILNKPSLATVATSGNYNDLNNKPSVAVIDDSEASVSKVYSSEKTSQEIANILPIYSSRGSIVTFDSNYVLPLVDLSVDNSATKVFVRGSNLWDEQAEVGTLDESTGQTAAATNRLRSTNYNPIKEKINFYTAKGGEGNINLFFYDANKAFISKTGWYPSGRVVPTPTGTCFFKFIVAVQYGTTYNNDIGIMYPYTKNNYEAYKGRDYNVSDISDILTIKGVNNIFADNGNINECKYKVDLSNVYTKKETDDICREIESNCYSISQIFNFDGYVALSGNFSFDSSAKRTDYIDVEGFSDVTTTTSISSSGYAIAFFDENYQFISGVPGDGKKTYTSSIPVNAKYVIFSEYEYPSASAKISKSGNLEERIEKIEKTFIDDKAAFSAFAKFGVCGDSLSVGHTQDASGTNYARNIYYSWGQYIAREYGNVCLNFGKSGVTAKAWMSDDKCYDRIIVADNKCQCYVIGLGANDAENISSYSDGIGSSADIDFNDMSNNADSFYGWYAKIINTINTLNPTAIVFLLTLGYPRDTSANVKSINEAIVAMSELAGFSNVLLVDLREYDDYLKKNGLAGQIASGHFSALGYANVARIIEFAISKVMNDYTKDHMLFEIPFIPFGSNNVLD